MSSLLDLLRAGGYVLYARHGEATVGEDMTNLNFQYCVTQRNLSDLGRGQAYYYGQLLRSLQIPVAYPVLASPFCRTIETAQWAFGTASVYIDPFWVQIYRLNENLPVWEQARILEALRLRLGMIPPQGINRVIIAHSFPIGIGLGEIPNMGTVIVRPLGQESGYQVIAKLSLEELASLHLAY